MIVTTAFFLSIFSAALVFATLPLPSVLELHLERDLIVDLKPHGPELVSAKLFQLDEPRTAPTSPHKATSSSNKNTPLTAGAANSTNTARSDTTNKYFHPETPPISTAGSTIVNEHVSSSSSDQHAGRQLSSVRSVQGLLPRLGLGMGILTQMADAFIQPTCDVKAPDKPGSCATPQKPKILPAVSNVTELPRPTREDLRTKMRGYAPDGTGEGQQTQPRAGEG
jgi:hypothetical protein